MDICPTASKKNKTNFTNIKDVDFVLHTIVTHQLGLSHCPLQLVGLNIYLHDKELLVTWLVGE
jgi:hypothetical protein